MGSHADVVITLLATSLPALAIIAGIGLYLSFKLWDDDVSTQSFICANGKAGTTRLAWSFVAASLGSWVVMRPGYYGAWGGILGLCVYAVCLGAPLLLIAACGKVIMRSESSPTTLAAFIRNRFNSLAETYVAALVFFNTAVLLLAEYSSLIAIFHDYVDATYVPVLLAAGGLSLLYTVCGGFRTTMVVNTYQCAAVSVCSVGLACYFIADYRPILPEVLTTEQKGFTAAGYSTLAIFPLALFSSAMFNEGLWQRCWAASSPKVLVRSTLLSSALVTLTALAIGTVSLAAQYSTLPPLTPPVPPPTLAPTTSIHPYYSIFQALRPTYSLSTPTRLASFPGIAAALAAVLLSQASISSLQSALTATFSSYTLLASPLFLSRTFSVLGHAPLLLLSLLRLDPAPLLHLSHILCSATLLPLLLAIPPALLPLYNGDMLFYSVLLTFALASSYSIHGVWDPSLPGSSITAGLRNIWWRDTYVWQHFLAVLICSLIALAFCILLGLMLRLVVRETAPAGCFCLGDNVASVQQTVGAHWDYNPRRTSYKAFNDMPPKASKDALKDGLAPIERAISGVSLRNSLTRSRESLSHSKQYFMDMLTQRSWAASSSTRSDVLAVQRATLSGGRSHSAYSARDAGPGGAPRGGRRARALQDDVADVVTVGAVGSDQGEYVEEEGGGGSASSSQEMVKRYPSAGKSDLV